MRYQSTKTYGHELGLSACFRQWRAPSHCHLLHGYALAFKFVFEATELDHRHWVVDFGGLSKLKQQLQAHFDHKLIVAEDDPELKLFCSLPDAVADVVVMPTVGCEAFAEFGWRLATRIIAERGVLEQARIRVVSCEVREHGANSAIFMGE